jgi:hypothetical protein
LEKIKHNLHLSKQLLKSDHHIKVTNHISKGYKEVELHLQSEAVSNGAGSSEIRNTFSLRWLIKVAAISRNGLSLNIGLEDALTIPTRQDKK